jgi:hypothetical protein
MSRGTEIQHISANLATVTLHTNKNKTYTMAFSPQANYTDRAAVICRRNLVPNFVNSGVLRSQVGGSPTAVNLSFLDRSRYISFK